MLALPLAKGTWGKPVLNYLSTFCSFTGYGPRTLPLRMRMEHLYDMVRQDRSQGKGVTSMWVCPCIRGVPLYSCCPRNMLLASYNVLLDKIRSTRFHFSRRAWPLQATTTPNHPTSAVAAGAQRAPASPCRRRGGERVEAAAGPKHAARERT